MTQKKANWKVREGAGIKGCGRATEAARNVRPRTGYEGPEGE